MINTGRGEMPVLVIENFENKINKCGGKLELSTLNFNPIVSSGEM